MRTKELTLLNQADLEREIPGAFENESYPELNTERGSLKHILWYLYHKDMAPISAAAFFHALLALEERGVLEGWIGAPGLISSPNTGPLSIFFTPKK